MNCNVQSLGTVHAVVNLNSEDFYWMYGSDAQAEDKLVIIEALLHNSDDQSETLILDGGEYGVFAANTNQVFQTRAAAKAYLKEQERTRACELLNETATVSGLLRFLMAHDAIKMPEDTIAREVLYVHMEDAGLGNLLPLYNHMID